MRPYKILSASDKEVTIYIQSKKFNRACSKNIRVALYIWIEKFPNARIHIDMSNVNKLYASSFATIANACRLKFNEWDLKSNVRLTVSSEEVKKLFEKSLFTLLIDVDVVSDNVI